MDLQDERLRQARCVLQAILVLCVASALSVAADWHVDNLQGDDAHAGDTPATAVHSIALAIAKAGPGDTLHLADTGVPYRQTASFYGHRGGEPGRPVTLDGHGATLSGAEPCSVEGWVPYRGDTVMRATPRSQAFLLVDGEMVPMTRSWSHLAPGEFCYMPDFFNRLFFHKPAGTAFANLTIEVGQPDGNAITLAPEKWQPSNAPNGAVKRYNGLKPPTWVKLDGKAVELVEARDRLEPGQWTVAGDAMYFRPPTGKALADMDLQAIVRANGVMMNGDQGHFIIRNLNVTHVSNDGFNIHGNVKDAVFRNCNAWDVGDEGFSSHDTCETLLDGGYFRNCDNGIANVNASVSVTRNVRIENSRAVGILLQPVGVGRHVVENAILVDNPSQLNGSRLEGDNLLVVRTQARSTLAFSLGAETRIRRATAVNNTNLLRLDRESHAVLRDSAFGPDQGVIHCRTDDPLGVLSLDNVTFGKDLDMQWGSRFPWTTVSMGDLLQRHAGDARLQDSRVIPELANVQLLEPERTSDVGCAPELIEAYRRK